jgi:uncharacterized protein
LNARFAIFLSVVATVLGLSAFYIGVRFVSWSQWAADHETAMWLTFAIFIGLQFLGPILYRKLPNHVNRLFVIHWVIYTALGVFACMFLYIVAADAVAAVSALVFPSERVEQIEAFAVAAMILTTALVGSAQVAVGPRVYEVDIPLAGLPPAFDGFRIVQISDLHIGPTLGKRYARRCVRIANSLKPDIIALTGDFVDGSVSQLRNSAAPLRELKAKQGVYFVTGNHEYYWDAPAWIEEFKRLGARVLLNEHVTLRKGGGEIVVAGVTDYSSGRIVPGHTSDPKKAIEGAPKSAIKILLAHHPKNYVAAVAAGFHLQISGHTHGGQFFPFSIFVHLVERYYKGRYKHDNLWLYVNRGTGYWGPPLRFGVPSEISVIKLRAA